MLNKEKCGAMLGVLSVVGVLMLGEAGVAQAEGACPAGYAMSIGDGARIHRSPDLNSPVDGIYYTEHAFRVHQFVGGTPGLPDWVNMTNDNTGVTGWVHGSMAACLGLTPPQV
ncbi:hypothetical protein [Saccharopolyspora hattusasensis]|uniref:hypothetical protein n=1 Tax=Saccharopolyspora hattusasensis TaxID=1128679 RepID=UPI003D959572